MPDPVVMLFGVSWQGLDRHRVETFLDTAGDEGLTWEVKGDEGQQRWPRREQIEKAVSAFANSRLGGVLVIGANRRREEPGWDLPGLKAPAEQEIEVAISKTIRTGVAPIPPFRVKQLGEADGLHAAIVWVEPVPDPPCVTSGGLVFQRATGVSEKVTDPSDLARLFDGGDRARAGAEAGAVTGAVLAMRAAVDVAPYPPFTSWPGDRDRCSLGVAAVGYEGDIGRRLVAQSFREKLEKLVVEHFKTVRTMAHPCRTS